MPPNKTELFIKNTFREDPEKGEILTDLQELALIIKPKALQEMKYGGLCFFVEGKLCTGIFVYSKHLSVEFGSGAKFKDKHKQLEGNGKYRRHIKLYSIEDVDQKQLQYYLEQAFH